MCGYYHSLGVEPYGGILGVGVAQGAPAGIERQHLCGVAVGIAPSGDRVVRRVYHHPRLTPEIGCHGLSGQQPRAKLQIVPAGEGLVPSAYAPQQIRGHGIALRGKSGVKYVPAQQILVVDALQCRPSFVVHDRHIPPEYLRVGVKTQICVDHGKMIGQHLVVGVEVERVGRGHFGQSRIAGH